MGALWRCQYGESHGRNEPCNCDIGDGIDPWDPIDEPDEDPGYRRIPPIITPLSNFKD